jgi:hypothetical protein
MDAHKERLARLFIAGSQKYTGRLLAGLAAYRQALVWLPWESRNVTRSISWSVSRGNLALLPARWCYLRRSGSAVIQNGMSNQS